MRVSIFLLMALVALSMPARSDDQLAQCLQQVEDADLSIEMTRHKIVNCHKQFGSDGEDWKKVERLPNDQLAKLEVSSLVSEKCVTDAFAQQVEGAKIQKLIIECHEKENPTSTYQGALVKLPDGHQRPSIYDKRYYVYIVANGSDWSVRDLKITFIDENNKPNKHKIKKIRVFTDGIQQAVPPGGKGLIILTAIEAADMLKITGAQGVK